MQPDLFSTAPRFDGTTIDPAKDDARLRTHLARVKLLMADGQWRTLQQIALAVGCSEAGASARLRDLRKKRMGSYTVSRKRVDGGLWAYRVEL